MTPEEQAFLRDFFRKVSDEPLDPDSARYVRIYDEPQLAGDDPVELMARAIEWTPAQSVQLLSGFRGTGKSTELRRLRKRLSKAGYVVVLSDMEDYLNLGTQIDVTDFLMALAGAFGDGLLSGGLVKGDPKRDSYWARLVNFLLSTKIDISEISTSFGGDIASVDIKANLKSDPTFRQKLQRHLAGHLGALVKDVREYIQQCIQRLKSPERPEVEAVLLVDSVEHIRGTFLTASEVQASVETLFAGHADKLNIPYLHVVYTIPPYLKVRYANLGALYGTGGVLVLPALKVRNEADGSVFQPGLDAMERVVRARGDWPRLLGERAVLDGVILQSGGHLRDLLRLLGKVLRRAASLPVSAETVDAAVNQIRSESLPIADADAVWLNKIANTHQASLDDAARLPDLARFLDTHMVVCYRNGAEWYDVNPLIREVVAAQATSAGAPQRRRPAASRRRPKDS